MLFFEMEEKLRKINLYVVFLIALLFMVSCGVKKEVDLKPYDDEFFEKTRLIMLRKEIKIYKHLPGKEAREAFIKEFWEKRDPNPETPGNEVKDEFDRRIEYINRWFSEKTGKGRGWESDRGRVYLLLGEPDERSTGERTIVERLWGRMRVQAEFWVYNRHRLYLEFRDIKSFGEFRLRSWSPALLEAIKSEKFAIFNKEKVAQRFKFKAKYDTGEILIQIPVKYITFEEREGKMRAEFKITVYIYHNNKKTDDIEETRALAANKDEILKKKYTGLTIPYTLPSKGKYSFDITVTDVISGSSYRNLIRHQD